MIVDGYLAPDAYVPADWANHKNRNPPSSEPGTDYALAYGTPLYAPYPGTVIEIKTSNSGGMGRYVAFNFDDGRSFRHIHMSRVDVGTGLRVNQGDYVGLSGASGYNSDWYYGPHVHSTLWPAGYWSDPTIDFQLWVGTNPSPQPPKPEPELPKWMEDEMDYYAKAYDDTSGRIWLIDIVAKTKRQLSPSEWAVIDGAYSTMGFKTPCATKVTSSQLNAYKNIQ